jgi:hypothetical protein
MSRVISDFRDIAENYRNRWTLFVYYGIRALLAVAVVGFAISGNWASAFATAFTGTLILIPPFLKGYYKVYVPFALELGIVVFTFLTLFLGWVIEFYHRVPQWDKFLHFQSGLLLATAGFVLVYILNEQHTPRLSLSPGFVSFFATTFSIAMAVLWEILEFVADLIQGDSYWQGATVTDTMIDLIVNLIGAVIIATTGYFWMRHRARLPFTPRLLHNFRTRVSAAIRKPLQTPLP